MEGTEKGLLFTVHCFYLMRKALKSSMNAPPFAGSSCKQIVPVGQVPSQTPHPMQFLNTTSARPWSSYNRIAWNWHFSTHSPQPSGEGAGVKIPLVYCNCNFRYRSFYHLRYDIMSYHCTFQTFL